MKGAGLQQDKRPARELDRSNGSNRTSGGGNKAVGPLTLEILFDGGWRPATSQALLVNDDANVARYWETTLTRFSRLMTISPTLRIVEQEAQEQKDATASALESLQLFTDR